MSFFSRLSAGLFMGAAGISLLFYPFIPDWMASHWDIYDNPDRFVPRGMGLFVIPIVMGLLYFTSQLIVQKNPYTREIESLKRYYEEFLFVIIGFLFYIHFMMVLWNSGIRFSVGQLVAPAFGAVLYYLGHIVRHAKPSSEEKLWKKTHGFVGQLFQIAGVVSCLGFLVPSVWFYFAVFPFVFALIHAGVYLFTAYERHQPTS